MDRNPKNADELEFVDGTDDIHTPEELQRLRAQVLEAGVGPFVILGSLTSACAPPSSP